MLGNIARDIAGTYINGNYFVKNTWTGSKIKRALRVGEEFDPDFPDSIDLKITTSCSRGCKFCHENSIPWGPSFDFNKTIKILEQLPKVGIELAIGGGNVFDIPEKTVELLEWCNKNHFLPRITLNYQDLLEKEKLFSDIAEWKHEDYENDVYYKVLSLSDAIGVSLNSYIPDPLLDQRRFEYCRTIPKHVYHVILGVLNPDDFLKMYNDPSAYFNILILGFKQFGRAQNQEPKYLDDWKKVIREVIWKSRLMVGDKKPVLGFDNLAIEQLELHGCLTSSEWASTYFGAEFSSTMYIDAVKGEFAPTSRSISRTSWDNINIIDYFKQNKNSFNDTSCN